MGEELYLGGKKITSRLIVGTGKFPSKEIIPKVIEASGTAAVTVALRRVDFNSKNENILEYIEEVTLMPNTSGARNAEEAIRIAKIARAAGCGDWVKIEVIKDNKYLLPDNYETIIASEKLVKEGFRVFPYVSPDLMVAKKLEEIGVEAVMPFGAPIGSNRGLKTKELLKILISEIKLPIIVDAGIGRPSEACEAMEMGAQAVLVNTAIATAKDPVIMAQAFKKAVEAGRMAYEAGPGAVQERAEASSPLTGFLREESN